MLATRPAAVAPRRQLPLRRKLLFAGAIAVLGAAVVEGAARSLVPAPLEWREHPGAVLRFDPARGWALRPNAEDFTVGAPVHVNAAGFRDREFPTERHPGLARIACVGDSYTYGWGVSLDESYPKQLETILAGTTPTEVLNFGVFGYNADQVLATIEGSALAYSPDLVLYGFYWDDLLPVRPELLRRESFEAGLGRASGKSSWPRQLLRRSRALYFAVDRARAVEAAVAPPQTRFFQCFRALLAGEDDSVADLWEGEARAIAAMRDACARKGARLAVVVWPLESQVLSEVPACRFQESAQRICDAAGVPAISMLEPLRSVARDGKAPYLPFEQHPTPEAYRRCSRRIAEVLAERGLLPPAR